MKKKFTPTAAQQEKAEARKAAFKELCQRLAKMSEAEKAAFIEKCPIISTCEGRLLSGHNTMLIWAQLETATMVGGFHQWKAQGRAVKKGEHGLALWIPRAATKAEKEANPRLTDSDEPQGFFMGCVFDVSQTEEIQPAA